VIPGRWTELVALVAGYAVAVLTTPAGISGAVLLLPFQVRILGISTVAATPTNLLYNVIANIRVVQEVLGHTRVTTTERYTHVATLQMKDASERIDQALWGEG
jgi:hypothetical protein